MSRSSSKVTASVFLHMAVKLVSGAFKSLATFFRFLMRLFKVRRTHRAGQERGGVLVHATVGLMPLV
jgi:hypothetical protein